MNRVLTSLILITGLLFSADSFARELERARPLDADREMMQMAETTFMITIEVGESFDISARGITRVSIDVTKHLHAATDGDGKRLVFRAREAGKAVVLVESSSGDVTTFIVTVV